MGEQLQNWEQISKRVTNSVVDFWGSLSESWRREAAHVLKTWMMWYPWRHCRFSKNKSFCFAALKVRECNLTRAASRSLTASLERFGLFLQIFSFCSLIFSCTKSLLVAIVAGWFLYFCNSHEQLKCKGKSSLLTPFLSLQIWNFCWQRSTKVLKYGL